MAGLVVLILFFVVFAVLTIVMARFSRRRWRALAEIDAVKFTVPASEDLESATREMLAGAPGMALVTGDAEGGAVVTAAGSRFFYVAARLRRPVAVPIRFETWRPRAVASFNRAAGSRMGVNRGVPVEDTRLGRAWRAVVEDESQAAGALDADPAVWPVVCAMTPALVIGDAVDGASAPSAEPVLPPASGFRLSPDTGVSFRGRFVLVGPGPRRNLSSASKVEDLQRAAAFVATSFDALSDDGGS